MKLQARSVFGNLAHDSTPDRGTRDRGVIATDRDRLNIIRMAARKGRLPELVKRVAEQFGVELQSKPVRAQANGLAFIGIGVDTWVVSTERDPEDMLRALKTALDEVATVSDQSGGSAVLRLTGPRIREALARCVAIDLHPREFQPGAAATTIASHIPLTLWRLDDGADGHLVFEVIVQRSLAESFTHVLAQSAGEFGLTLG
jgi:heterotetrameric sarcosine oxidase gamma subunit